MVRQAKLELVVLGMAVALAGRALRRGERLRVPGGLRGGRSAHRSHVLRARLRRDAVADRMGTDPLCWRDNVSGTDPLF